MPELPEVETVRRGLIPMLAGRRIVRLQQRRKDLRVPMPKNFAGRVEGRTVGLELRLGAELLQSARVYGRFTDGSSGAPIQRFKIELLAELPRDRKSTRLNSSHMSESRMPSSA